MPYFVNFCRNRRLRAFKRVLKKLQLLFDLNLLIDDLIVLLKLQDI